MTKNSQEYSWGQITPFSLIKQWKISWITWSRASYRWTLGKLPFLVYRGMCHWTGYGFFYLSVLNRLYNFVWDYQQGIACCPKQGLYFRIFCPKQGEDWWTMFFTLFTWLDGWSKTRIRTQDYFLPVCNIWLLIRHFTVEELTPQYLRPVSNAVLLHCRTVKKQLKLQFTVNVTACFHKILLIWQPLQPFA